MTKLYIGMDIGGTNLKGGLLTGEGTLLHEAVLALCAAHRSDAGIVEAGEIMVKKLLAASGLGIDSFGGVGLGVAGIIDAHAGIITEAPQFPLWRDFPLARRLAERLGIPVAMENDVNAIARGELWRGAAQGKKNFLCMAMGTGLGGAVCLDGRIWRGESGMAGEVGHVCVEPGGARCGCGSFGCLETFASAVGLIRRVKENHFSKVLDSVATESEIPQRLARLAEAGDAQAREYWDVFGRALGLALGGLLNTLNVKLVLLGGGLSRSFSLFQPSLESEIKRHAFAGVLRGLEFRLCTLGDRGGVYGAVANLLDELEDGF